MKTHIHIMVQDDIVNASTLLLGFSRLTKAQVRQFTTGMNQYLIASPLVRRQMIKSWEEGLYVMTKRANV